MQDSKNSFSITIIKSVIFFILVSEISISFWIFSRFTVDDAFISWRYGENLINHGVWNFNPIALDKTQAYSSPLFAVLSIIPPFLKIDTVLFFKLFSCVILFTFIVVCFRWMRKQWVLWLAFLAIPATLIHLFSGIETFCFIFSIFCLLVFLQKEKTKSALLAALFLLFLRPESWLLIFVLPLHFLMPLWGKHDKSTLVQLRNDENVKKFSGLALSSFLSLAIPLGGLLIFNLVCFGDPLPNPFYIKTAGMGGKPEYTFAQNFFSFLILFIPTCTILFIANKKLLGFCFLFFLPIISLYSKSNLEMNYSGRFSFHVWAPLFLFGTYLLGEIDGSEFFEISKIRMKKETLLKVITSLVLPVSLTTGLYFGPTLEKELVFTSNYYPRLQASHSALGKVIRSLPAEEKIDRIVFSDAGALPFFSDKHVLDNNGLGSAMVAHQGITELSLETFNPDVIIFVSYREESIIPLFNQPTIYKWAVKKDYKLIANYYFEPNYILRIFSTKLRPTLAASSAACNDKNKVPQNAFFQKDVLNSPFRYWRE